MTTRKEIRDLVAGLMRDQNPSLSVFTGRTAAIAEAYLPLVRVAIDEGQVTQNLSRGRHETAVLTLQFVVDGDDDLLDSFAEPAIAAVIQSPALAAIVLQTLYVGYSYNREEAGAQFNEFSALFEVTHING